METLARAMHPGGADVVIDATGHPDMLRLGARLARFGGVFVLAAYFGGRGTAIRPDVEHERNVRVLGRMRATRGSHPLHLVIGGATASVGARLSVRVTTRTSKTDNRQEADSTIKASVMLFVASRMWPTT